MTPPMDRDPSGGDPSERPDVAPPHGAHMLALGTRLRDFEVTGLIGEGGFGIVYLAYDHSLQRQVAIKEYMPSTMVSRTHGSSVVVVKSARHQDAFEAGLRSFVNEARLLARFDHPSLVKVYRYWEENGTAYMAMPYYRGPTLKTVLAELGRAPTETELRTWLRPLLDALTVMHAARCYHRDIAPDNILITARGPLLLDFGAARRVIGDMTHALTVMLKPGYAPIEQYGDVATMAQGAWTDLYALASVVYFAITGSTPISSVERLMDDRLVPLAIECRGRYSDAFLRTIDRALAVRPHDRPQDEAQFRASMDEGLAPGLPAVTGEMAWFDSANVGLPVAASAPMPLAPTERRPAAPEPPRVPADRATMRLDRPTPIEATVAHAPRPPTTPPPRASSPPVFEQTAWAPAAAPASAAPSTTASAAVSGASDTRAVRPERSIEDAVARTRRTQRLLVIAAAVALVAVADIAVVGSGAISSIDGKAGDDAVTTPTAIVTSTVASQPLATTAPAAPVSTPPLDPVAVAPASETAATSLAKLLERMNAASAVPAPPSTEPLDTSRERPTSRTPVARTHVSTPIPARTIPADAVRTPALHAAKPARCSDILQKASLEPLTADEASFLKRECR